MAGVPSPILHDRCESAMDLSKNETAVAKTPEAADRTPAGGAAVDDEEMNGGVVVSGKGDYTGANIRVLERPPFHELAMAVARKIVQDHDAMARVRKRQGAMRPDITRPTRHQNRRHLSAPSR